jgi:pimeloyl-ACP methyl ester carboxylesterase
MRSSAWQLPLHEPPAGTDEYTAASAGGDLRGLVRRARDQRGVIVALHGTGINARYWDAPGVSLLDLAPELGYSVVALNRPGYAPSSGSPMSVLHQAPMLLSAFEEVRDDFGVDALFLMGHSAGAIVALSCAAQAPSGLLHAVDVSGAPLRWRDAQRTSFSAMAQTAALSDIPLGTPESRRSGFLAGAFDDDVFDYSEAIISPIPAAEVPDPTTFIDDVALMCRSIAVPMRVSVAEYDATSVGGSDGVAIAEEAFPACPWLEVRLQRGTSHNISLHRIARGYHLGAIAFFDDVLSVSRRSAEVERPAAADD